MGRDVSIEFRHWEFDTGKDLQEQLEQFPFDEDWRTNEDYYQGDTLELGYKSEAERLVSEWLQDHQVRTHQDLQSWIDHLIDRVYRTDSYYVDWNFSLIAMGSGKFAVACYLQNSW